QRRQKRAKLESTHREYHATLERSQKRIDDIARLLTTKDSGVLIQLDSALQVDLQKAVYDWKQDLDNFRLAEAELKGLEGAAAPRVEGFFGPPEPSPISKSLIDDELRRDQRVVQVLEPAIAAAREKLKKVEMTFDYQPGSTPVPPAIAKAKDEVAAAEKKRDEYLAERRTEVEK